MSYQTAPEKRLADNPQKPVRALIGRSRGDAQPTNENATLAISDEANDKLLTLLGEPFMSNVSASEFIERAIAAAYAEQEHPAMGRWRGKAPIETVAELELRLARCRQQMQGVRDTH